MSNDAGKDAGTGVTEVQKTKKQASFALVGLLLAVALLAFAFVAFDGAQFVADLFSGDTVAEDTIPDKPTVPTETTEDDADVEPSDEATESTEETTTEADTSASGSSSTTVVPPNSDALSRMFWEQVGSQDNIGKLVRGEISSFSLGGVTNNGDTASIGVTANYKSGGSVSGTMVLRNYSSVWYFSSISAGGGATPRTIPADTAITSTIVEQTPSNQDIPLAIINGGYTTCSINSVSAGSGTATVGITLSGGTSARVSGQIVCVSKIIGGTKYWFITSFRRS